MFIFLLSLASIACSLTFPIFEKIFKGLMEHLDNIDGTFRRKAILQKNSSKKHKHKRYSVHKYL